MKKFFVVLCLGLALALPSSFALADAQPQDQQTPYFDTFKGKIGYDVRHLEYQFDQDTQKGWFNGFMVGADFHLNDVYLAAEFSYFWGDTDWDSPGYSTDSTTDKMYDLKAVFGYDFFFGKMAFTPYAGLAMRHWETTLDGSFSYPYTFQQYYAPVGAQLMYKGCGPWTASLKLEYDFFLLGQIDYKIGQADPLYTDMSYDQHGGFGFYISANFTYSFVCWSLGVEPYFQYWDIDKSDSAPYVYNGQPYDNSYEPENTTKIWGVRVFAEF